MKSYITIFVLALVVGLVGGFAYFNRALISSSLTGVKISGMVYTNLSESSVRIAFETSKAVSIQIEYGTSLLYGVVTDETTPSSSHSIVLSGLLPGKDHNFRIHMKDSSGKVSISRDYVIKAK